MKKIILTILITMFAFNVNAAEWEKETRTDLMSGTTTDTYLTYADQQDYDSFGQKAYIVRTETSTYFNFRNWLGMAGDGKLTLIIDDRRFDYVSVNDSADVGKALFVNSQNVKNWIKFAKVIIAQATNFQGETFVAKWTFNN